MPQWCTRLRRKSSRRRCRGDAGVAFFAQIRATQASPLRNSSMTSEQSLEAGLARQNAGQLAEAERIYRDVLARDAENLDALYLLGCLLHLASRNEESIATLRQALSLGPDMPEIHTNYALVCRVTGRVDEAIVHLRRAAVLEPS